jgi:hypothetical protein
MSAQASGRTSCDCAGEDPRLKLGAALNVSDVEGPGLPPDADGPSPDGDGVTMQPDAAMIDEITPPRTIRRLTCA